MKHPFPAPRLKTLTRANVARVVNRFNLTEPEQVCNILLGVGESGYPMWKHRHLHRASRLMASPVTQRAS